MKLRTLWTLLARPLLPRCCPEQSSSNWTRNAEMLQANESLVLRTVPPAGFEPALPPPEGGALSPELRGLTCRETCGKHGISGPRLGLPRCLVTGELTS